MAGFDNTSAAQRMGIHSPSSGGYGVEQAHYEGPHGAGVSYQKGYRSSFERSGGAFTSKNLAGEHLAGMSSQNRGGLVNWEGGSTPPGFQQ